MSTTPLQNIEKIKKWLSYDVYPLWSDHGIDHTQGGFVESLSFDGTPLKLPRRAMVQSRQIYSFLTGAKMECFPRAQAYASADQGVRYMINKFSLPNGAFRYSIEDNGTSKSDNADLYTQAFALFGLAQGYAISGSPEYKERAKALLHYLKKERAVPTGGYTETDDHGKLSYRSNPHMHLFEAAIAWMQVDAGTEWKDLGAELIQLCLTKFIDPKTEVLAEYFDKHWNRLLENEKFIYEPGHQYEWAWLMSVYEGLTKKDLKFTRHKLFFLAEQFGTSSKRKIAYDEMWSDFKPKKISSRFWPQCERIKAAIRLAMEVPLKEQLIYTKAADDAMETLFKFLQTPKKGMWYDQLSEADSFSGDLSKSSSLYHIINAMEEYVYFRPQLPLT